MNWLKRIAIVAALLLAPTAAFAQTCNGQISAGKVCANPTGATAPPSATTIFALINQNCGSPGTGSIPFMGSSALTCIAPLASGVLVTSGGNVPSYSLTIPNGVMATTQADTDSSTKLATTAFAQTAPGHNLTSIKSPVQLATTANVTLSGEQTIDGVLTSASRILVRNQNTASQNGCYVTAAGAWARCVDFNTTGQVVQGTQVFVTQGTAEAGQNFSVTTANPITIGSTSIAFVRTPAFDQAGTGAVTQTMQSKVRQYSLNVLDYGAVCDAYYSNTLASAPSGGTLYFNNAGAITSGGTTFTVSTGVFASTDVGKSISIAGAGSSQAASFTGTIATTTLTVSSVSGTIAIGQPIVGVGVSIGTFIVSGSGTTWTVNNSQTVGPVAMRAAVTPLATTIASYTSSTVIHTTATAGATVSVAAFSFGTDDTANLQSAIDWAAQSTLTRTVVLPPAQLCGTATGLTIRSSNVSLSGSNSYGPVYDLAYGPPPIKSGLVWLGGAGGSTLTVAPPSGASNPDVTGVTVSRIGFALNQVGDVGLNISATVSSDFNHLFFFEGNVAALYVNGADYTIGGYCGVQKSRFSQIGGLSYQAAPSGTIIMERGNALGACDPSLNAWHNVDLLYLNQIPIKMLGVDNEHWYDVSAYLAVPGIAAHTILFDCYGGYCANSNTFDHVSTSGDAHNAAGTSANLMLNLDKGNSVPDPTGPGAVWTTNNGVLGGAWGGLQPVFGVSYGDILSGRANIAATETMRIVNGAADQMRLQDNTDTNEWGINIDGANLRFVQVKGGTNTIETGNISTSGSITQTGTAFNLGNGVFTVPSSQPGNTYFDMTAPLNGTVYADNVFTIRNQSLNGSGNAGNAAMRITDAPYHRERAAFGYTAVGTGGGTNGRPNYAFIEGGADGGTSSVVTFTTGTPTVVNWAADQPPIGMAIQFNVSGGGGLPSGISVGTVYYVLAAGYVPGVSFEFATSPGGTPINTTTAGSGTFYCGDANATSIAFVGTYLAGNPFFPSGGSQSFKALDFDGKTANLYVRDHTDTQYATFAEATKSFSIGAGSGITSSGPGGVMTSSAFTANATANTVSTLVARDGSGNFAAGTITASLTGHSSLDLALTGGTLTGALLFTDNTYDIGAAGATRPRAGYFGTSITVGSGSAITSSGAGGALGTGAFAATGTSGGTIPLLNGVNTFSGSSNTFSGQIVSTFGTPTIASGACGTGSNGSITGTNQSGAVTIGASATTSCAISFSATITAPNACVIYPGNAGAAALATLAYAGAPSTTGWTITGSVLASTIWRYICL